MIKIKVDWIFPKDHSTRSKHPPIKIGDLVAVSESFTDHKQVDLDEHQAIDHIDARSTKP